MLIPRTTKCWLVFYPIPFATVLYEPQYFSIRQFRHCNVRVTPLLQGYLSIFFRSYLKCLNLDWSQQARFLVSASDENVNLVLDLNIWYILTQCVPGKIRELKIVTILAHKGNKLKKSKNRHFVVHQHSVVPGGMKYEKIKELTCPLNQAQFLFRKFRQRDFSNFSIFMQILDNF